jgi:hypothetical protein
VSTIQLIPEHPGRQDVPQGERVESAASPEADDRNVWLVQPPCSIGPDESLLPVAAGPASDPAQPDLAVDQKPKQETSVHAGEKSLYEYLGIRFFKRWMPTTGDKISQFRGRKYLDLSSGDIKEQVASEMRDTKIISVTHGVAFLGMAAAAIWAEHPVMTAAWTVANIAVNVYPLILQRYNFVRLAKLMDKLERRAAEQSSRAPQEEQG